MERDWSKQSPHIRTLYAPWQLGDGYEESIITTAEERIGSRLPAPLRVFYQAWGQRKDLTQTNQVLLGPGKLMQWPDVLIFCVENQGGSYWAIESNALREADPPVLIAEVPLRKGMPDLSSPPVWEPSHAHISDFLDSLIYQHAFWGGAIHGGSGHFQPQAFHQAWLEHHWHSIMARVIAFPLMRPEDGEKPLYIRDGLALDWSPKECTVVARSIEDLDEIGQILQVMWTHRW